MHDLYGDRSFKEQGLRSSQIKPGGDSDYPVASQLERCTSILNMVVQDHFPPRGSSNGALSAVCLEDKFELIKEIGDGSFGSVALARVRTAGAHVARRGTLVSLEMISTWTVID